MLRALLFFAAAVVAVAALAVALVAAVALDAFELARPESAAGSRLLREEEDEDDDDAVVVEVVEAFPFPANASVDCLPFIRFRGGK